MGFIQCAFLELRRKKAKYLILYGIFVILFSALLSGKILSDSVSQMKQRVVDRIGPCLEIRGQEGDDQPPEITEEMKQDILGIRHVRGINQRFSDYVLPVNGENVKDYVGETPDPDPSYYEDGPTPDMVVVDANLDCAWADTFRKESAVLLEGEYPTEDHPGLLMEQRLAKKNSVGVGDSFRLRSVKGKEISATVTGIYQTKGTFEITEDNFAGEGVFAWSPYNRIYSNLSMGCQLLGQEEGQLSLNIYTDSITALDTVAAEIKGMLDSGKGYVIHNETEEAYRDSKEAYQIDVLENYARIVMGYALVIGVILLSLVLNLYLQYYYRDAGILIALGAGRYRIVLQFLTVMAAVVAVSAASALGIVFGVMESAAKYLLGTVTVNWDIVSSFEDGLNEPVRFVLQYPGVKTYLLCFLVIAVFWLASCIPLLFRMRRFTPRSLFCVDER